MAYYNTSVPNPTLAARSAAAAPSPAHSRSTIHADTPVAQPSTSRGRTPKGTVPRAPEGREQRARSPPLGAVIEPSPVRRWRNYLYSALVCFLLTMLWSVLDPFDIAVNADVPSRYLPRSLAVKFVSGDNIKWIDELQDWEKLSDSIETMKKGDQKVDQGLPTSFGKGKNPNDVVTFGNSFGRNMATLFRLQVVSSRNMNLVHDLYEDPDVHVPSWALQPIRGVGDCWKQRPSKESRYANDLTHSVRIPFSIELLQLALDRKDGPCTVELWGVVAWEDKEAMSRVAYWRNQMDLELEQARAEKNWAPASWYNAEWNAWVAEGLDKPQPDLPGPGWVLLGTTKYDASDSSGMWSDIQTFKIQPGVKRLKVDFQRVLFKSKGKGMVEDWCSYWVRAL